MTPRPPARKRRVRAAMAFRPQQAWLHMMTTQGMTDRGLIWFTDEQPSGGLTYVRVIVSPAPVRKRGRK